MFICLYVVYFLYVNFLNIYWYVNICDNVMGFCDIYINKWIKILGKGVKINLFKGFFNEYKVV